MEEAGKHLLVHSWFLDSFYFNESIVNRNLWSIDKPPGPPETEQALYGKTQVAGHSHCIKA